MNNNKKISTFAANKNQMKELTAEELVDWKRIITDVMREFDKLCHENGLRYFTYYGSAIGAVRHQGFIPWDDDMDVAMPRPDLEKFMKLCENRDLGDYELVTPYNTKEYPLVFMKFCNKKTTLIESSQLPCVIGAYIDIFPLDGISTDGAEAEKVMNKFRKLKNKLEAVTSHNSFVEYVSLLKDSHEWGRFVMKTCAFFCREKLRKCLLAKLDTIVRCFPYDKSLNVTVYNGSYGHREIMPKSLFEGDVIRMPFENISIDMPSGYDEYLTRIYGDYMQLPPEEKRVTHHFHEVFDMTKRLDKKEALSILKSQSPPPKKKND